MFKTFNCSSLCSTRDELKPQDHKKQLLGSLATMKEPLCTKAIFQVLMYATVTYCRRQKADTWSHAVSLGILS